MDFNSSPVAVKQARIGCQLHGQVLSRFEEEGHTLRGGFAGAGETVLQHVARRLSRHNPVLDQQGEEQKRNKSANPKEEARFKALFTGGGTQSLFAAPG